MNMLIIKNAYKWLSLALFNKTRIAVFFEPVIQLMVPSYRVNTHRARVLNLRNESTDAYTLKLKVRKKWGGFVAGQFIELIVFKNGIKYSRFFTISSCPSVYASDKTIEITIQTQKNGRITPWLKGHIKSGDYVNISCAKGEFTINDTKSLLFIAAGSGITPFRSMLKDYTGRVNIHLMYYAKPSKHLFIKELSQIEKSNNLISISIINSSISGRFSQIHLRKYCADFKQRLIYVCGPAAMIESTTNLLRRNNIKSGDIYYEYFGAKPLENLDTDTTGSVVFEKSTIRSKINTTNNQTLLDMAESMGIKPKTGCRMGICHQCICQKNTGVIYNTKTQSYSDTGSQKIQLCISVPVGNVSLNL